jgi:hypothetical protein
MLLTKVVSLSCSVTVDKSILPDDNFVDMKNLPKRFNMYYVHYFSVHVIHMPMVEVVQLIAKLS